jgi:hypothetical protein
LPKFSPFRVQFDKPTWELVKKTGDIIKGNCIDSVILAVRVAYVVLSEPNEMLSEAGQDRIKHVVKVFRNPLDTLGINNKPIV